MAGKRNSFLSTQNTARCAFTVLLNAANLRWSVCMSRTNVAVPYVYEEGITGQM